MNNTLLNEQIERTLKITENQTNTRSTRTAGMWPSQSQERSLRLEDDQRDFRQPRGRPQALVVITAEMNETE